MTTNQNALSYWFPKLEAHGLPVPHTRIIAMPEAAQECMWAGMDGKDEPPESLEAFRAFCDKIRAAATELGGYPCFLRTDHTSGKHRWRDTCHLASSDDVPQHVFNIIEYSEIHGMFGELPWSTWAVRELLPVKPFGTCRVYGDLPVCREFRFFVDDGKVLCWHPYWPREALEQGGASPSLDYDALCVIDPEDFCHIEMLATKAGKTIGGAWSVDILETARGWHVTDMARASESFHWPGCEAVGKA